MVWDWGKRSELESSAPLERAGGEDSKRAKHDHSLSGIALWGNPYEHSGRRQTHSRGAKKMACHGEEGRDGLSGQRQWNLALCVSFHRLLCPALHL